MAEIITVHTTPAGDPVDLIGALQAARHEGASQVWEVDRYVVRIPPGVTIENAPEPVGSLPPPGTRVQVHGHWNEAEVAAETVKILPQPVVVNSYGTLEVVPPAGVLGEWTIREADGDVLRFVVESPSVLDTRSGSAEAGMVAYVRLQDSGDGRLVALRVRIDWPD
jgi:hypothetical protein